MRTSEDAEELHVPDRHFSFCHVGKGGTNRGRAQCSGGVQIDREFQEPEGLPGGGVWGWPAENGKGSQLCGFVSPPGLQLWLPSSDW